MRPKLGHTTLFQVKEKAYGVVRGGRNSQLLLSSCNGGEVDRLDIVIFLIVQSWQKVSTLTLMNHSK